MERPLISLFLLALSASSALPRLASADAVVFVYHRFAEGQHPATNVRLEQFESHLDYLERHNFTVWPLERIVTYHREGRAIPDRTVAITVDDAYLSVYTHAYPRLKARGWPFTVFVATQPVDRRLADFMSWEQMREMSGKGASFANHGVTHEHLVQRLADEGEAAWRARMRWELDHAQQRLRAELGVESRLFAYPYGEHDEALAALVSDAGYVAFGQQSGPIGRHADARALPRYPMAEAYAPLEQFAGKANSLALPVLRALPWNPVVTHDNPPRMELHLAERLPRAAQVACYVTGQGQALTEWLDDQLQRLVVKAREVLPKGRSRYNCTIPGPNGRYYWYSHGWLVG